MRIKDRIKKVVKKGTLPYAALKGLCVLAERSKLACEDLYIFSLKYYYHSNSRICKKTGVSENSREVPIIVSLTTIPARINKVYLCIETLMKQSLKPDRIILWLTDSLAEKDIPEGLKKLRERGLQIEFCEDVRSYTKIFYALLKYPGSIIVTADDDVLYPHNWLSRLYEAYRKEPHYIHCHRAHLMVKDSTGKLKSYLDWSWFSPGVEGPSFLLFPTGVAGVLYPPGSLHSEVLNKELFMRICPTADDVWLKAMSLLNGVPCKKVSHHSMRINVIRETQAVSLWSINREQHDNICRNDMQLDAVFSHYNLHRLI